MLLSNILRLFLHNFTYFYLFRKFIVEKTLFYMITLEVLTLHIMVYV